MRCDLFSYGVVLWELFTHKEPFEGFEAGSVMFQIGNGRVCLYGSTYISFQKLVVEEDMERRGHEAT